MSYRDDAYFNLNNIGEPLTGTSDNAMFYEPGSSTNPNARPYPDNKIRFLATQAAVDNTNIDYTLKRGYIRGLPQPGISDSTAFTSMKCQFQFNPQTIQQVVTMDQSTLLPLLQDPYQFTQPMGKSTNFQFDLVFDRSRNVVHGSKDSNTNLENGVRYKDDVGQIGALADLYLLYGIIGQGFSKELIDYQVKRLAQASIMQINSGASASANSPTSTEITNDNVADLARNAINLNIGNAAFIIPTPVRVIFSSLFMVDGFVTGTTVDFLKFNTNMVPVQIRVGLSMEAMYLGFARQKTFLTQSLELAGQEIKRQEQIIEETRKELATAVKTYLSKVAFGWSTNKDFRYAVGRNADTDFGGADNDPVRLYQLSYVYNNRDPGVDNGDWGRAFNLGFPDANQNNFYGDNNQTKPNDDLVPGGRIIPNTSQSVKDFFVNSGEQSNISITWYFEVYGPYDTAAQATAAKDSKSPETSKHCGTYTGSTNASDSWFWAKTWPASSLQNSSKGRKHSGLTLNDYLTARNNKYYVWKLQINAQASVTSSAGPVTLEDSLVRWGSGIGSSKVYGVTRIDWVANRPPGQDPIERF